MIKADPVNLKILRSMLHFCRVTCRIEYEIIKQNHTRLFSILKPEKCTMFVTFLLRAE